jgi:hypothetical protein
MAAYDPAKAALYNKLIQSGVSQDAAFTQSGISEDATGNYAIGSNGQLGATIAGGGKVAGVDYDNITAANAAESNRFNQGLASSSNFEQVDYAEDDKAPPGKVTPINYTTTSTQTVSGGGSTTITAGPRVANSTSTAIQPAINAKQAEINQFTKDNPSDFARKKQGLPPLSPEEKQQRQEKLDTLSAERGALKNQQIDAESTTPATITTVPNTTTTTQTVTTGTSSTNQAVDPEADQKLSQENETQLDATTSLATDRSYKQAAPLGADGQPIPQVPFEPVSVSTPGASDGTYSQAAPLGADGQPMRQVPMEVDPADDPFEAARLDAETRFNDPPVAEFEPADVGAEQLGNDYGFTSDETEGADPTQLSTDPAPVETSSDQSLNNQQTAQQDSQLGIPEQTAEEAQNEANFLAGLKNNAKSQGTLQSRYKQPNNGDWRVRLSLAPNSNYLYNAGSAAGVLAPLAATNGVIFPYTPNITTSYNADYEKYNLIHSNYRGLFYKSSSVGDVQIRGTFTAQDTREAAYLLAVIHFFRSVTKMFYGQDAQRGTPPPLVYLSGYGGWQFNNHACVVSSFNYSLPNEVDYIRTDAPNNFGPNMSNRQTSVAGLSSGFNLGRKAQLLAQGIFGGAIPTKPAQNSLFASVNNTNEANYVPTKMEIDITLIPVQTRSQVSKQFSLEQFASGRLLKGGFW